MVMYAGRQVEIGTTDEIFYEPRHPYTLGPARPLPRLDDAGDRAASRRSRVSRRRSSAVPTGLRVPPALPVRRVPGRAPPRCPSSGWSPATRHRPRATSPSRRRHRRQLRARSTSRAGRGRVEPLTRGSAGRDDRRVDGDRSRRARRCSRSPTCVKDFPIRGGMLGRTVGNVHAVSGVSLHVEPRRDARPGGGVGLRQVDDRRGCCSTCIAPTSGAVAVRRRVDSRSTDGQSCARCGAGCRSCSRTRTRRSTRA